MKHALSFVMPKYSFSHTIRWQKIGYRMYSVWYDFYIFTALKKSRFNFCAKAQSSKTTFRVSWWNKVFGNISLHPTIPEDTLQIKHLYTFSPDSTDIMTTLTHATPPFQPTHATEGSAATSPLLRPGELNFLDYDDYDSLMMIIKKHPMKDFINRMTLKTLQVTSGRTWYLLQELG